MIAAPAPPRPYDAPGAAPDGRDLGVEAWIKSFGLSDAQILFRRRVRLDEIDVETSLRNQARLGERLDRTHVETLALSIMDGAVMPPLICWEGKRGLVVIDGNHRVAAFKEAGVAAIDLYVVMTHDQTLIDLMTRTCNAATGGKPVETDQKYQQGLLLLAQGHSTEEVARRMRLKRSTLTDKKREQDAGRRLKDAGVKNWSTLPSSTIGRLATLQSDVTLKNAAELIIEAKMALDAATDLIHRVRDAGSEAKADEIIDAERRAYQEKLAQVQRTPDARAAEPAALRLERLLRHVCKTLSSGKGPQALGWRHQEDVDRFRGVLADLDRSATIVLAEADRLIRRGP